jgi:hypothetical protein
MTLFTLVTDTMIDEKRKFSKWVPYGIEPQCLQEGTKLADLQITSLAVKDRLSEIHEF